MLNELVMKALGGYAYQLQMETLYHKNIKTAYPDIANCHCKRLILAKEPSENKPFSNKIVKLLTGDRRVQIYCIRIKKYIYVELQ